MFHNHKCKLGNLKTKIQTADYNSSEKVPNWGEKTMWYLLKEQVQSSMEGKNVKLQYGKEARSHGTSPTFEE